MSQSACKQRCYGLWDFSFEWVVNVTASTSSCKACVPFTQAERVNAEADQYLIDRGLPDLEQAVADQWIYDGSSYCQEWPLAPALTPIRADL